jgi:hypothetical protein
MGSLAIWHTTSTPSSTTTTWSHCLRPCNKREITSRPCRTSLNRMTMKTMRRAVHVLSPQLTNLSLISLPPKAKRSYMPIPPIILTMVPHLSLRWNFFVGRGFLFGWLRGSRKGIIRDVGKCIKFVPKMVRFCSPHLFLRKGSHRFLNHLTSLGSLKVSRRVLGHCTHQPYQNQARLSSLAA